MINNPYKDYLVYKNAFDMKELELNKANVLFKHLAKTFEPDLLHLFSTFLDDYNNPLEICLYFNDLHLSLEKSSEKLKKLGLFNTNDNITTQFTENGTALVVICKDSKTKTDFQRLVKLYGINLED